MSEDFEAVTDYIRRLLELRKALKNLRIDIKISLNTELSPLEAVLTQKVIAVAAEKPVQPPVSLKLGERLLSTFDIEEALTMKSRMFTLDGRRHGGGYG